MKTSGQQYTVGQLAKLAGVTAVTIRFYEKKGLIPKARRSASGYRYYGAEVLNELNLIHNAKEAGFSLDEAKELVELSQTQVKTGADVKKRLAEKITEVEGKIAALAAIERSLKHLTSICSGEMPAAECPIIRALVHNRKSIG
ncbi:heavy metal-responsive transcriptional regulator [Piscirickettsia litoralis]|uniref:Heavy metal-responsive transcriptional regulator n=2 Tax=Piscirickettsia litoralis TaxID=1891921 RepID=A0ABX3A5J2_9GAMM|nr:heavy metal-responsive transcriptional regulator [Piscirickettsia litoralis]